MKRALIATTVAALAGAGVWLHAQDRERPVFRVKVDMVVLSFTVTDSKGRYVTGLKPGDFKVTEDGISQKIATFAEGNKTPLQILDDGSTQPIQVAGEAGRSEGARRRLRRHERVRAVRHLELHVPRLRLRVRRDRRFRPRP